MGKVSLNINGRAYGLGCEDGEEARLTRLGEKLDQRVQQMADQFGQIGDLRLLVMAGITLLDEMEDPESSVEAQVNRKLSSMKAQLSDEVSARQSTEAAAADNLMNAAKRIERLAKRLSDVADA